MLRERIADLQTRLITETSRAEEKFAAQQANLVSRGLLKPSQQPQNGLHFDGIVLLIATPHTQRVPRHLPRLPRRRFSRCPPRLRYPKWPMSAPR